MIVGLVGCLRVCLFGSLIVCRCVCLLVWLALFACSFVCVFLFSCVPFVIRMFGCPFMFMLARLASSLFYLLLWLFVCSRVCLFVWLVVWSFHWPLADLFVCLLV